MIKQIAQVETGRYAANKLTFDPSGTVLGIASNNGNAKFISNGAVEFELKVNDESCQAISFDRSGEFLVAAGNGTSQLNADGTFKIFQ